MPWLILFHLIDKQGRATVRSVRAGGSVWRFASASPIPGDSGLRPAAARHDLGRPPFVRAAGRGACTGVRPQATPHRTSYRMIQATRSEAPTKSSSSKQRVRLCLCTSAPPQLVADSWFGTTRRGRAMVSHRIGVARAHMHTRPTNQSTRARIKPTNHVTRVLKCPYAAFIMPHVSSTCTPPYMAPRHLLASCMDRQLRRGPLHEGHFVQGAAFGHGSCKAALTNIQRIRVHLASPCSGCDDLRSLLGDVVSKFVPFRHQTSTSLCTKPTEDKSVLLPSLG